MQLNYWKSKIISLIIELDGKLIIVNFDGKMEMENIFFIIA